MKKRLMSKGTTMGAILCGFTMMGVTLASQAGDVLPYFEASPEYYKVISESDDMRVILATWPPGAKDNLHSHPGNFAVYILSDCHRKIYKADGKVVSDKKLKPGKSAIKKPVKAHVFENVGSTECKILLVEMKK